MENVEERDKALMETREEIDRLQIKLGIVGLGFFNYNFSKKPSVPKLESK